MPAAARLSTHVGQFLMGLGILFAIIIFFTGLSGYEENVIEQVASWGLGFIYTNGLWQGLIGLGVVLMVFGFYIRSPTIELRKDVHQTLKDKAAEKGTSPTELANDLIMKGLSE